MSSETFIGILMGIGLSAATGFRIFIPFLIAGTASMAGYLNLSESFSWIGTTPALITFGAATVLEILAYYIPWVDNLLDSIASPLAVVAGAVIMVSVMTDIPPLIKWVLAIIAGGGVAGLIQSSTAVLRLTSSVTTGGVGNPAVSTTEAAGSAALSAAAVFIPVIAVIIVIILIIAAARMLLKKFRKQEEQIQ